MARRGCYLPSGDGPTPAIITKMGYAPPPLSGYQRWRKAENERIAREAKKKEEKEAKKKALKSQKEAEERAWRRWNKKWARDKKKARAEAQPLPVPSEVPKGQRPEAQRRTRGWEESSELKSWERRELDRYLARDDL